MSDGRAPRPPGDPSYPTFLAPEPFPGAPPAEVPPVAPWWSDPRALAPRTAAWLVTLVALVVTLAAIPVGLTAGFHHSDAHPDDEWAGLGFVGFGLGVALIGLPIATVSAIVTIVRQRQLNRSAPDLRPRPVPGAVPLIPIVIATLQAALYLWAAWTR